VLLCLYVISAPRMRAPGEMAGTHTYSLLVHAHCVELPTHCAMEGRHHETLAMLHPCAVRDPPPRASSTRCASNAVFTDACHIRVNEFRGEWRCAVSMLRMQLLRLSCAKTGSKGVGGHIAPRVSFPYTCVARSQISDIAHITAAACQGVGPYSWPILGATIENIVAAPSHPDFFLKYVKFSCSADLYGCTPLLSMPLKRCACSSSDVHRLALHASLHLRT
jgi:hypothetical protein